MFFESRTITVYASGLNVTDEDILIAAGNTITWSKDPGVDHFNVHFDESPFDSQFGAKDYPDGTPSLTALSERPDDLLYVHCHKYTLTVTPVGGAAQTFDPHIIVVAAGVAK